MEQRRITMSDIVVGKPLPWDVYDASNKLLLRRGHIVQRAQQVETLMTRGLFVAARNAAVQAQSREPGVQIERPSALRLINLSVKRLERLLFGIHGETEWHAKIREVAKAVSYAVTLNPDVALACILLNQESGSYPVRHSIDTAVVAMLVARAMNKQPEEIEAIMTAALAMNVGMLRHHNELHHREGELSDAEREVIRNHPKESVAMLRQAGVDDEAVLSYVLLHHENEDGSGYPLGKQRCDIPENAKIISLADRYCARVSARNYRKSMLPNAALRDILMVEKTAIDPRLAACFIRELGTYPTGTFVRMFDGEIGIVTCRGSTSTTPIAHALVGPRGAPLAFPIKRDTQLELHAVREVLHESQAGVRVSMQRLWGDDARL